MSNDYEFVTVWPVSGTLDEVKAVGCAGRPQRAAKLTGPAGFRLPPLRVVIFGQAGASRQNPTLADLLV